MNVPVTTFDMIYGKYGYIWLWIFSEALAVNLRYPFEFIKDGIVYVTK